MKIHHQFIGQDETDCTFNFTPGDREDMYKLNRARLGPDWYYYNKEITYNYNRRGHRCKNIEEIDLDNYILFAGCSHTEGVGLELEKTYPYLLSQYYNCDYYNLSLAGTGIDTVEFNLLTWFTTIKKKPKFVVIQWPDHSRFLGAYPNYPSLIPNGSWMEDENGKKFISSAELSGFYYARKYLSYELITKVVDVPIVEGTFSSLASYSSVNVSIRKLDLARDMAHSGMKSHQKISEDIIAFLSDKYMYERLHHPA